MSLPAFALMIAAVGALREAAPEWVRVEMAPHEPVAMVAKEAKALVAVFIGDETHPPAGRRGWYESDRTVELAVQILLPPRVEVEVAGARLAFDTHTNGPAPLFAAVERLIECTFNPAEAGGWGGLWQEFVLKIDGNLDALPFVVSEAPGARIPGLDLSIPCQVIGSPPPGEPGGPWAALLSAMRADSYFQGIAPFVEDLIRGNPALPWQQELVRTGMSRAEGSALGLGCLPGVEATPPASRFSIGSELGPIIVEPEP